MSNLVEYIDKTADRFARVAPPSIKFESEKGFAISILNNNSYLAKVASENPSSLVQAVASVASVGLSLNPAERQAYLITRSVKTGQNKWESRVFLEPSYMGLCKLATDSGTIKWVQANVVYSNDQFTDNGPGERPTHTYSPFSTKEQRGDFVGVYCVAKTSEGDYLTTIMPADEVYGIRDRSEAWKKGQKGPWATDFLEQAKKSVVRRAFKMWPRSDGTRMAEAVHLSNENEGFEPILTSPEIKDYTAEQKQYFDQLITQSSALGMLAFQQTLDESTFTNLYHSFEKGQKGKYQRIVDELLKSGRDQAAETVTAITEAVMRDDDAGTDEIVEELSAEEWSFIQTKLPAEINAAVQVV
jgi:phage RecT family recombinase